MKYEIKTDGMGCQHCIDRVTKAMNTLGAEIIKVELNDIVIRFSGSEAAVREAIEDLGFDVLSITAE